MSIPAKKDFAFFLAKEGTNSGIWSVKKGSTVATQRSLIEYSPIDTERPVEAMRAAFKSAKRPINITEAFFHDYEYDEPRTSLPNTF